MKPTINITTQNNQPNTPAVIFRPTFHATGIMLQAAILDLLANEPKVKLTIPRIQLQMHQLFQKYGMSYFLDEQKSTTHESPELTSMAEAVAHVTFPEFFGESLADAEAKYAPILATKKAAPAPEAPAVATDPATADNAGKGTETPAITPDSAVVDAVKAPEAAAPVAPAPEAPAAPEEGDDMSPLRKALKVAVVQAAEKERTATAVVTKAAAEPAPGTAAAKKAAVQQKAAETPKKAAPKKAAAPKVAKNESLGDKLFGAERKVKAVLDADKKAAAPKKATAPKAASAKKAK